MVKVSNENQEQCAIHNFRRSACGNCKYFTKRTKRTGTCEVHKTELINLKKGIKEERLLTVFKYHLCEHYA